MRWVKVFLTGVMLWSGVSQAALTAGKDYETVPKPQAVAPKSIEVLEFFWYGCPHCYHLESKVNAWKARLPKNVVFKRVPVLWSAGHEKHAKVFYAIELLKLTDRLHGQVFNAVQGQGGSPRVELRDEDELKKWVASKGVNPNQFMQAYNAFSMGAQLQRARQQAEAYQIQGVPTFIVQGKYSTSPSLVGNEDRVFQVLNELIAQEQAKIGPAPAPSPAKPAVKAK